MAYVLGFAMWFFLCELVFLVASLPVVLLFSEKKNQRRIYTIKRNFNKYRTDICEDFRTKEYNARLAAMTPKERRQHELMLQKQEEEAKEEMRRQEEEARKEEEDLERWLANRRCVCRFCSAALNNNALLFVEK